ncbi:unnamed protein product [Anisakis simplex]|uniref:PWWP domain-containing protein n=1 Tax=Anisakis simplex TaxID=6269 RepID=A0A0M3JRV5_ANISI|nr:unnamed protein product [Anisakis simplex]
MTTYQPGDLVWAKMKGFPPWPATILQSSAQLIDVPANRYSVMFFGTKETAIMKNTDLFNYLQHRKQFEVSRKQKGFAEAIQEIRVAAGIDNNKSDPLLGYFSKRSPSPPSSILHTNRVSGRTRRVSSKLNSDDFFLEPLERKRSISRSSRRSRTNSASSQKARHKSAKAEKRGGAKTPDRKRDSIKRNSVSLFDGLDGFDSAGDTAFSPMLCDGALTSLLDGLDADIDIDSHTKSSKRLQKQKAFEEFISSVRSPSRERSSSTSSSCRMRLFSGMSDVFDELLESVQFNPAELLSAIDNLPSEEERPATPEEPLPMPAPNKCCSYCGCECELFGLKWRCTGKSCLKWNGTHDPYGTAEESVAQGMDASLPSTSSQAFNQCVGRMLPKPEDSEKTAAVSNSALNTNEKNANWASIDVSLAAPSLLPQGTRTAQPTTLPSSSTCFSDSKSSFSKYSKPLTSQQHHHPVLSQNIAPNGKPILPRRQLGTGRPKSYKVEKTPPVSENGQRHCAFCGGQVRPQMCGGNKHRWRCVDKKCRKWYGWVRSNEEIPKDLGKKGRWKDLALKIKPKGDAADSNSVHGCSASIGVPHSQNAYITAALPSENDTRNESDKPKRRYHKRESRLRDDISRQSSCSPLPAEVMCWRASAMEQRCRWWISEKRRQEASPEREWSTQVLDVAASMRLIGNAMNAAASTRADEPGTVAGTLDLLMDALMSSLGPLLALSAKVPQFKIDNSVVQRLWNSSAIHTPLFPS